MIAALIMLVFFNMFPDNEITKSFHLGGYSTNSCSDNAGLFQHMFPDSEIAKSFQLGPTKIKYLTNFGIAPYYKSVLLDRIKKGPCFVISYNESLNPMTHTCERNLLACYFDETEEKVKIRHLDLQFLVHRTPNDFKACVCYLLSIFYFSLNDSTSKTMKNVFLFHLKSTFHSLDIQIFVFSPSPLFSLSVIALEVDSRKSL